MADATLLAGAERSGYDSDFSPPLPKRLECPICLGAQRNPMQTSCGHRFCEACLTPSLRSTQSRCPLDFKYLRKRDIFPDKIAAREVLDLTVNCKYKLDGCEWNGELRNEQDHYTRNCMFQSDECPNGCGCVLPRKDFSEEAHLRECSLRTQACDRCQLELFTRNREIIEAHNAMCTSSNCVPLSAKTEDGKRYVFWSGSMAWRTGVGHQAPHGNVALDLHGSRDNPVLEIAADWDQEIYVDLVFAAVLKYIFTELDQSEFFCGLVHFAQKTQAEFFTQHFSNGTRVGLGRLQDQEGGRRPFLLNYDTACEGYSFFVPKDQEKFSNCLSRCFASVSQMRSMAHSSSPESKMSGFHLPVASDVPCRITYLPGQTDEGNTGYTVMPDAQQYVPIGQPASQLSGLEATRFSEATNTVADHRQSNQHPSSMPSSALRDDGEGRRQRDGDELIVISDSEDDLFGDEIQVIDNMLPALQPIDQELPPAVQTVGQTLAPPVPLPAVPYLPASSQATMFGPIRHHPSVSSRTAFSPYGSAPCIQRPSNSWVYNPAQPGGTPSMVPAQPMFPALSTFIETYLGDSFPPTMAPSAPQSASGARHVPHAEIRATSY